MQDALQRLAIGTREVFGQQRAQALTIRCAVSFAVNWLMPRLPAFLDQQPGTTLRLLSSVWNTPFDAEDIDLDIQYGTGAWPGCNSHRLTWETLTPLCAPDHKMRAPGDLRHRRLLHVLGYHEGWGIWLKAAGVAEVDPGSGLHLDTSLAAFELARHGGGVALGRSSLAAQALESGRLVAPFDLAVPVDEGFYLLEPAGGSRHPQAAEFKDWLITAAGRARTEGRMQSPDGEPT